MTIFITIGALGFALLLLSVIVGDVLEGIFDSFDFDIGGGIITGPAIGAFLATFGFGAALISYSSDSSDVTSALGGVGVGVVAGGIVGMVTRTLMNMPTDEVPRSADLIGGRGTVITRIPEGGMGEVSLHHGGHNVKLNARAPETIVAGTAVVVVDVTSSTSVVVNRVELQT